MIVKLSMEITPTTRQSAYKSLDVAEEFLTRLLDSDFAQTVAAQCGVSVPQYERAKVGRKLHTALGFQDVDESQFEYACWEEEPNRQPKRSGIFPVLAGSTGAAEFNGNVMREWKRAGGQAIEEEAGVHLLIRDGALYKKLWIEAQRRN